MLFPDSPTDLTDSQTRTWPLYADNLLSLSQASATSTVFTLPVSDWSVTAVTLSYRKASISADLTKIAAGLRPCFLCRSARPSAQLPIPWHDYEILVNPYPLGPLHLTIPSLSHRPQRLSRSSVTDMLRLAALLPSQAVFYNGPRCGASAPDHFHFQAIGRTLATNLLSTPLMPVDGFPAISISGADAPYAFLAIDSDSPDLTTELFFDLLGLLPRSDDDPEPPLNLFALSLPDSPTPRLYVIPRRRHRPTFYGDAPGQLLVSPASLEMAGLFVTPSADHTSRLTPSIINDIYSQVAFNHSEILSLCLSQLSR